MHITSTRSWKRLRSFPQQVRAAAAAADQQVSSVGVCQLVMGSGFSLCPRKHFSEKEADMPTTKGTHRRPIKCTKQTVATEKEGDRASKVPQTRRWHRLHIMALFCDHAEFRFTSSGANLVLRNFLLGGEKGPKPPAQRRAVCHHLSFLC